MATSANRLAQEIGGIFKAVRTAHVHWTGWLLILPQNMLVCLACVLFHSFRSVPGNCNIARQMALHSGDKDAITVDSNNARLDTQEAFAETGESLHMMALYLDAPAAGLNAYRQKWHVLHSRHPAGCISLQCRVSRPPSYKTLASNRTTCLTCSIVYCSLHSHALHLHMLSHQKVICRHIHSSGAVDEKAAAGCVGRLAEYGGIVSGHDQPHATCSTSMEGGHWETATHCTTQYVGRAMLTRHAALAAIPAKVVPCACGAVQALSSLELEDCGPQSAAVGNCRWCWLEQVAPVASLDQPRHLNQHECRC